MTGPVDHVVDLLPERGFFRLYHELTDGSEICPRFHFFTAAGILGSVIARRVRFQRASSEVFPTLYPNPWVVLVAPQGVGHKTAALAVGRKLLTRLSPEAQPRIFSAKVTPESLVKTLALGDAPPKEGAAHPVTPLIQKVASQLASTGLIYSTELGVLLGREKYNVGMIALLTELYDCQDEWTSSTIMRGDQKLYNVALSLLGASTPDWMQSMLPSDAFKGGFMSRLLLVSMPVGWEKKRVADPPKADPATRDRLVEEAMAISQVNGTMIWDPEARDYFTSWYMDVERDTVVGPVMAYLERKQDHLLRFAMLLQIAETREELVLKKHNLERSLAILNTIESETSPMVEYLATEPRMRVAQHVLELLRTQPQGITESKLVSQTWRISGHPRELDDILSMLCKARAIRIKRTPSEKGELVYEWIADTPV